MTRSSEDHSHLWETHSTYRTLEGSLHYQRCACGLRRMTVALLDGQEEAIVLARDLPASRHGGAAGPVGTERRALPVVGSGLTVLAAMATTLVLWSSAFVAIRIAVEEFSVPGLTLARLVVASIALAAVAPVLTVRVPARADALRLIAIALTGMTGYQLFLNSGERTVDAGTANLLVNMSPVFAAVLAWLLLASRPTTRVWTGIGLGFAGASILALAQGDGMRLSVDALLVLTAALCQATFFVLQKPVLRRYTAFEVTCYATWIATISALPATAHVVRDVANANTDALTSVVFLGVGSSATAYATWAYVLGRIDVASASNMLYLAPLLTIVIGWAFINEKPSAITLVGGAIILAGVVIATHGRQLGSTSTQRRVEPHQPDAIQRRALEPP